MPLTPSDLDRNRFLDKFAIGAFSSGQAGGAKGFLARLLFPVIGSEDETGKYFEIDFDSVRRDEFKPRAPGDPIPTGNWKMSTKTYGTEQYAYGEGLPEEFTAKKSPTLDVEEAATMAAMERALISQEVRFGAAYWQAGGVWGIDKAGAAAASATEYIYWNRAAATPVDDSNRLSTALKLKGNRRPNTFAMGADVKDYLINNGQILGRLNNGQTPGGPAQATLADLAKLFEVDRVLVADGTYNSAAENATATPAFILNPKSAWLGYVDPNPTKYTATAGATFTWETLAGNKQGVRVFRRWDPDRRRWLIEVLHDDVFKIISKNCGAFLNNIVE